MNGLRKKLNKWGEKQGASEARKRKITKSNKREENVKGKQETQKRCR